MRYTITLEYQGKQYSFLDGFDYQGWEQQRNPDYQVTYMYTEGNDCCDCNRSDFLLDYCHVDFSSDPHAERDDEYYGDDGQWTLPCGRTIKLISIREGERLVWTEQQDVSTVVWIQQLSGIYLPMMRPRND